jgi:thiol-disulfide isomerase/thioredoxin
MKARFFFLLLLVCTFVTVAAQNTTVSEVAIGQPVPNVQVNRVRNYKATSFSLADFKGKLVIFDFWNVNCKPCLEAFPKLDSLQDEFGDKIQIILATKNTVADVDYFYKKRSTGSALHRYKPRLVTVLQDTVLSALFPFEIVPNSVWVNSNGTLQAVTDGQYLTRQNISKMLFDKTFRLPEKRDFLTYDDTKSRFPQLFIQRPGNLQYYSTLMKYVRGAWGSQQRFVVDSLNKVVRISRTGTIITFYGDIFSGGRAGSPFTHVFYSFGKRVVLNVKDSSRYLFNGEDSSPEYLEWLDQNQYQYETVLPLMSEKDAYQYYLSDINKFFGVEAKYENRKMKCLLLVRTSDVDKLKAVNTGDNDRDSGVTESGSYYIRNALLYGLIWKLSEVNVDKPFVYIDSTGYKGRVNIEIKASLSNIDAVRSELRSKYDLDLVEREQDVKVLVISEKDKAAW